MLGDWGLCLRGFRGDTERKVELEWYGARMVRKCMTMELMEN